ncbi:hypothetical protein ACFQPF_02730 [Fictibacillus iocasae]|uniref:Orc1-like AAA ATPase domain-containing protein n=1 Tax=Fictibacillus iocasae TaxID=2715437 RepID=A0ABW2NLA9_9BACL
MMISKLLMEKEAQRFVGRVKELEFLKEALFNTEHWRLVHIHGPIGIGKTALVKKFEYTNTQLNILYLSGIEGYTEKEKFLLDLQELFASQFPMQAAESDERMLSVELNRLSESFPLVLIFDSFEQWHPIYKWLRETWLPQLTTNIKILTLSRSRLPADWERMPGWSSIIDNLELTVLNKSAINEYLDTHHIFEEATRDLVDYYSKGLPLALRNICDFVGQNSGRLDEKSMDFNKLYQSLSEQLLTASPEMLKFRQLWMASSLLWFDRPLLQNILDEPITEEEFHLFCKSNYIERSENGFWRINDSLRRWLNADFTIKSSDEMEIYLKRASSMIKIKLGEANSSRKLPYIINTLHLHQSNHVKRFSFSNSQTQFAACSVFEEEIPILQEMFKSFVKTLKPFLPDQWQQESYFYEIWKAEPSSFIGFRSNGTLAGFIAYVPLNEKTRSIFERNPVYEEYVKRSPEQKDEYIIWVLAADPDYDPQATACIMNYIFSNLGEGTLMNVVSPFPDFTKLFESLGFISLDWYKKTYTGDSPMNFLQLDLRDKPFVSVITDKHLTEIKETQMDFPKLVTSIKNILTVFTDADRQEVFNKEKINFHQLETFRDINHFQKSLHIILEEMDEKNEQERIYASIILHAYIQKNLKHEAIAMRHNLSMSTYYRYLKKAIEKVSFYLSKR